MSIVRVSSLLLLFGLCSTFPALAGDIPDCDAGEKLCRIGDGEYICIPFDHNCPRSAEIRSLFRVELEGPNAEPLSQESIREITLLNQGCSGCRNSKPVELPGAVQDVELMSSRLVGGVSRTEAKIFGNLIFERTCFGFGTTLCGSVARTYLVSFEEEVEPAESPAR